MTFFENILREHGPMLSGELANFYMQKKNASNEAARKAVSRAKRINKLKITFEDNQKFCYLPEHFLKTDYCDKLLENIASNAQYHSLLINILKSQSGFASKESLPCYSYASVKPVKSKRLCKDIINELLDAGIINNFDENTFCLSQNFFYSNNINVFKGIETAKKMLLADFSSRLKKIGIASYNSERLFSECGNYLWNYTAPTYVRGISPDLEKNVPAFIVADILFGKVVSVEDINFFIKKAEAINKFKTHIIPVLIVDKIDREAFGQLKSAKIVIAKIDELFGEKYSELLNSIVELFVNITKTLKANPDAIAEIIERISKYEGKQNNVFGDFFELVIAQYYNEIGSRYIKLKEYISSDKTKSGIPKEVDLIVDREGIIYLIECKAINERIDRDVIQKWLNEKVPDIYHWASLRYPKYKFEFQYWAINGFNEDAIVILNKAKSNTKKYRIDFFNKESIINVANSTQVFKKLIAEHYN